MTSPVSPGEVVFADDVNDIGDATVRRPLVRLVASGTQSIPNNTATAIQFSAEDIDTHGFHDTVTNNTRVTPTAGWAGYYQVRGTVFHGARADYSTVDAWIRKGAAGSNLPPSGRRGPMGTSPAGVNSVTAEVIVFLDPAAGDYVELVALQVNTAAAAQLTNQSSQFSSVLELQFLRP